MSSSRFIRSPAGWSTTRRRSLNTQVDALREVVRIERRSGWTSIAAIGITNQRETTLLWDRKTGRPLLQRDCLAMPQNRADCRADSAREDLKSTSNP